VCGANEVEECYCGDILIRRFIDDVSEIKLYDAVAPGWCALSFESSGSVVRIFRTQLLWILKSIGEQFDFIIYSQAGPSQIKACCIIAMRT